LPLQDGWEEERAGLEDAVAEAPVLGVVGVDVAGGDELKHGLARHGAVGVDADRAEGPLSRRGVDRGEEVLDVAGEAPVLVDHVDEVEVVVEGRELSPRRAALLVAGFVGAGVEAGGAVEVDVIGDEVGGYDDAFADVPIGVADGAGDEGDPAFDFGGGDEIGAEHHGGVADPEGGVAHVSAGDVEVEGG
jgi:hypothetical protein